MHAALCLLMPGYVFHHLGWRRVGRAIVVGCSVALVVFVIWLGRPASDWAFFLLISAHVASVSQLIQSRLVTQRLAVQMAISMLLFTAATMLVYLPVRALFHEHVAMPLQTAHGVVIVNPRAKSASVRRGEVVAYRIAGGYDHGVILRSGYGLGPVLAVAGDRVKFTPAAVWVNDTPHLRLDRMPQSGELGVTEGHWFVWPDVRVSAYNPVMVSAELLRLAQVERSQVVGRPFKRWFFWKQTAS